MLRASVIVLLLALIGGYIYDRYQKFAPILFKNEWKTFNNFNDYEIRLQSLIRNCEDALVDEALGLALLSCDAGRDKWNTVMGVSQGQDVENGGIYIYDYANNDLPENQAFRRVTFTDFPSAETDFHPLGIEWEPATATLYVINHAKSGSVINIFQLSVTSATATHVSTIKHSLVNAPNSITSLGDGKIYFTNDHYIKPKQSWILNKIETFGGIPGGSVVYMDTKHPETAKVVARLPFANGIALFNETTLAVASSYDMGVSLYRIAPEHELVFQTFISTPPPVDNISVDGKGKLLMAGHPHFGLMMKVANNRALCNSHDPEDRAKDVCQVRALSWVGEWSEEEGLKELYLDSEFMSSTTAVRDTSRGIGIVTGLYEKGVLVFKN